MNPKMIILGVIMFGVLYLLYKFLLGESKSTITNLKHDSPLNPVTYGALSIPNSTRYSYYIWIYANQIDPSVDENIFFVTDKKFEVNGHLFSMYIKNTTDLCIKYLSGTTKVKTEHLITNNFPLQAWQQIIVSFDNNYMDLYHNGKFLKSVKFENDKLPVKTTADSIIKFGENKPDINIRLFERFDYPMDPQTAWNLYIKDAKSGSGADTVNYGLNLNLSTNNKPAVPIRLF